MDTSNRLRRLHDDFLRKEINDKQYMASKADLAEIKDEAELIRECFAQTTELTNANLEQSQEEVRKLERLMTSKDEPYLQNYEQ